MKTDKIVEFANRYVQEHIENRYSEKEKQGLLKDPWEALSFFMSKIYNQGRRDEISHRVQSAAVEVLREYKSIGKLFYDTPFNEIEGKLRNYIGKGHVGKNADIKMTIETMQFVSNIEEKNIIKYSLEKIKNNRLVEHFYELKSIHSIGDKIASFYLRDLISLYKLEKGLLREDYLALQPVDTWVRQTAIYLNIIGADDNPKKSAEKIVDYCLNLGLSPIHFNQGAWYLGANSYQILLEEYIKN